MKKKKGVVLILTIVIFTFLITILTALLTFTISNINNVNSYNKMNSSFYAAQSGMERVKYIVATKDAETPPKDLIYASFDGITVLTDVKSTLDGIKSKLNFQLLHIQALGGNDKFIPIYFPIITGYYVIDMASASNCSIVSVSGSSTSYKYTLPIKSVGHYKSNVDDKTKTVTSVLNINVTENNATNVITVTGYSWT